MAHLLEYMRKLNKYEMGIDIKDKTNTPVPAEAFMVTKQ